ncbi:MAG: hypothetical protein LBT10_04055 [Methanobrevibacter sp.]|nr:hypothetical protein [Methanobrevibacter sp.]
MQLKYLLQHSNVQIVEQTPIDTKDIKSLKIPKNSEGFIINEESAFYQEGKRIKEQIKIKQCQTADLEIIGWEPGKGKYKDTIGKLVCMYKGYQVKIGSGLTDNDRVMILANWDSIEGMFAEVKAMKFGETSIRMPIFVRLRLDKNEFSID